jgi:lipid-A-disaccharide synthase-like uncharacterized protein
MNEINIIDFKFNIEQGTLSLVMNLWLLLGAIALFFVMRYLIKLYIKSGKVHQEIIPVKLTYEIGGTEIEYAINRNYQNIEIAHRIYVELITRKAALPIDENHDIVEEIYDSWYTLFQTTREELKSLSGEILLKNNVSKGLIQLLTDILNKGLRPHLTEYQGKFRKWYNAEVGKEENENLSPQQIQQKYCDYQNLLNSMKSVNELLIEYTKQLKEIIDGDNTST